MTGWWVVMGAVVVAFAPRLHRHYRRRAQVDRVKAALSTWLPALKQPDGSPRDGTVAPPTFGSSSPPRTAVRCRRTLMFGALYPDISVGQRSAS
jgi:hypothetical protein